MSRFLNEQFRSLNAYTPGEQPRDMQYIKLNTNESPYPPAPSVVAAMTGEQVELLRLYSDPTAKELKEKLGCETVIHMDPIVVDDGVTEETRRKVAALVRCIDDGITIHDFRMVAGPTHTNVIFDAVVPFGFRLTDEEVEEKIRTIVRTLDGNYFAVVKVEKSYT